VTRDFAAEFEALRVSYVASLPTKLDELAGAVARRSLEDARTLAHRLRGTAASYFAPDVSTAAGAIEDALDRELDWSAIELLVADVRAAAAAVS